MSDQLQKRLNEWNRLVLWCQALENSRQAGENVTNADANARNAHRNRRIARLLVVVAILNVIMSGMIIAWVWVYLVSKNW